jgi:O-antigen/teichoic acid export membrane protein
LLSIPATLGLDKLIVREVAAYQIQGAWGLLRGLLEWTQRIVFYWSIVIVFISFGLSLLLINTGVKSLHLAEFCLALVYLPIVCIRSLKLATMRGLNQVGKSLLPEMFLEPLFIIILAFILALLLGQRFSPFWLICIQIISVTITFVLGIYLLKQSLPEPIYTTPPEYQIQSWFNSGVPLMLLDGMQVINARIDILMLGILEGSESVGIYSAVIRGTQLINFMLVATNMAVAPVFSSLYAQNNLKKLHSIYVKSSRLIMFSSLPIAAMLIIFRQQYLSMFGANFYSGADAIIILGIGQVFNVATGSAGVLLNMTGNERYTTMSLVICAVLNCIGNFLLIPLWGMNGAAIATSCSVIFVNLLKVMWIHKKIGLRVDHDH